MKLKQRRYNYPMKFPFIVWAVVGLNLVVVCGQETNARPSGEKSIHEPTELTQLRNAWLLELKQATLKLDRSYLDSLKTMKARLEKDQDLTAELAVEREIQTRLQDGANKGVLTDASLLAEPLSVTSGKMTEAQSLHLQSLLAGKVWRVTMRGRGCAGITSPRTASLLVGKN